MHIHDFHSKLETEEDDLFEALRSLTLVEDLNAALGEHPGTNIRCEWATWPPMGPPGSGVDSASS